MTEYKDVIDLIPKGQENAASRKQLGTLTGDSQREVSRKIHNLRKAGVLICSSTRGYYKPQNTAELIDCYDRLWSQSTSLLSSLKTIRKELRKAGVFDQTRDYKSRKKRFDK